MVPFLLDSLCRLTTKRFRTFLETTYHHEQAPTMQCCASGRKALQAHPNLITKALDPQGNP